MYSLFVCCFMPQQQNFSYIMAVIWYEMSRRKPEPTFLLTQGILKLRFHLYVMWMRTTNVNATKIEISTGVLPNVRMRMRTTNATEWIATCSDRSEFIGQENTSYTEPPHSSTRRVEIKLHWSLLICNRHSHFQSDCAQVESELEPPTPYRHGIDGTGLW